VRRSLVMLSLVAAWALVAAGCAGDEGDGGSAATPAGAAPETTATTATDGGGGNDGYGRDGDAGGGYGDRSQPAGGAAAASGGGEVRIAGFAFAPATLTAKVGQRVTWTHRDPGATHTVTADQGQFRSGELTQGDEFAHVFPTAGSFAYHCAVHPDMRGTVKVGG
jgi:plastocyanin